MPSSAATARTTTGCSFAVVCVCVSVCVFILFVFCVEPEKCAFHQPWLEMSRDERFFEFESTVAKVRFFCFLEKKKFTQEKDGAVTTE